MSELLYRGMDRARLDAAYNARGTVSDITPYLHAYAAGSETARRQPNARIGLHYGQSDFETLDLFPAGTDAPLFIFIHGGYWRLLSRDESSFMVPTFNEAGVAVAAISYGLAPFVTLDEIVRQTRKAVGWLWTYAAQYGIDQQRIHVCGTSAGGHLCAMLLDRTWQSEFDLPSDVIRGATLISGLYDLEPIRLCHVNEWMRLDEEATHRNSPLFHLPSAGPHLLVTYAEADTAEFKRQSEDYVASWRAAALGATCFQMDGTNHFDIVLRLSERGNRLTESVLERIQAAC